ncbi:MAG TPA: hypothetical protein VK572_18285, partial [Burkholderiales bacterium]|nr:hypothetical protein [Burkholderiales bacterium]
GRATRIPISRSCCRRRSSSPTRPSGWRSDQAQKIVMEDAPWIFVNSTLQIRAIRKEVKGYELNPTQMFFGMENVSLQ